MKAIHFKWDDTKSITNEMNQNITKGDSYEK